MRNFWYAERSLSCRRDEIDDAAIKERKTKSARFSPTTMSRRGIDASLKVADHMRSVKFVVNHAVIGSRVLIGGYCVTVRANPPYSSGILCTSYARESEVVDSLRFWVSLREEENGVGILDYRIPLS